LIRKVPLTSDTIVWRQICETLDSIDGVFAGLASRSAFRGFARGVLNPLFRQISWDRKQGEADNVAVLREDIITKLGTFAEPSVVEEARRRFQAFVTQPTSLRADIRQPTLRVAALWSDDALYEAMRGVAKNATDALEKDQVYVALASAKDPALAARSLDIALSDEPAATTGPSMIRRVAVDNADLAWKFSLDNLDKL